MLTQHPRMNASWVGDRIKTNPEVKVGLAMAVEDGVVVGVINKADTGELADIAVQRRDLTERARAGKLTPADITGATFTISNLGIMPTSISSRRSSCRPRLEFWPSAP